MAFSTAADDAAHLAEQYQTNDPFALAESVGAEVVFADLGELKGLH